MKAKIRNGLFILLIAVIAFSIVACGNNGDDLGNKNPIVTCYLNENSTPVIIATYDGEFSLRTIPEKDHYSFLGLFDEDNNQIVNKLGKCNIKINKSVTLWAKWAPKTCTVEFDVMGEQVSSIEVAYGENISLASVSQIEGYDFIGWYDGDNKISDGNKILAQKEILNSNNYNIDNSEKVKLTACYKKKRYNLTLNYNDGSNDVETVSVFYGDSVKDYSLPEKDTGTRLVVGWSVEKNQMVEYSGTFTSDVTLYAIWKDYKTFRFYPNEDVFIEKKVFDGEQYTISRPDDKVGYSFSGWYSSKDYSESPVQFVSYADSVLTYYAKYVPISYKITFVTNGGEESLSEILYNIEDEVSLPSISKAHCSFIGWSLQEDLSGDSLKVIQKGTIGDLVLYAKWKGDAINVLLDAAGGNLNKTEVTVEYLSNYKLEVPKCENYVFQGWYDNDQQITDKDGNGLTEWRYYDEITLSAKYSKRYYITIDYTIQGAGKVDVNEFYVENEKVNLVVQTIDDGFDFIAYYKNGVKLTSAKEYTFFMPAEDVEIELEFAAKKFNVTMDSDGGYVSKNNIILEYFKEFELPIAYKEGYVFDGWYIGEDKLTDAEGKSISVWNTKKDVKLKAKYKTDSDAANKVFVVDVASFMTIYKNTSKTFIIVSDIDMNGQRWQVENFSGKIVGNDYTIKNLTISSNSENLGMFVQLSGSISDLNFKNLKVTSTSTTSGAVVGGICAELTKSGSINNVSVNGKVSGKAAHVGGLVGKNNGGEIIDCVNHADVSGESTDEVGDAGGICGWNYGGTIQRCTNYGIVESDYDVGGIIGHNSNGGKIQDLTNHGEVKGKQRIGGTIANIYDYRSNLTINGLYNYGEIVGGNQVGGIIGYISKVDSWMSIDSTTLTITYCNNNGAVTGAVSVGGIVGYANVGYHSHIKFNRIENVGTITGTSNVGGLMGKCVGETGTASTDSDLVIDLYTQDGIIYKNGIIVTDLIGDKEGTISCKKAD